MLAGAHFLIAEDRRAGSVSEGRIDETHIGAAGHSQGGGGAIAAGADPIIDTVVPLMPGPQGRVGALHGSVFFGSGCGMCTDTAAWSRYLRNGRAATIPG